VKKGHGLKLDGGVSRQKENIVPKSHARKTEREVGVRLKKAVARRTNAATKN